MPILAKNDENRLTRYACTFVLCVTAAFSVSAQSKDIYEKYDIYRNPFRVFLNKFSISMSLGYGVTDYKNDVSSFTYFQDSTRQLIIRRDLEAGADSLGFRNWLSNPVQDTALAGAFFGDSVGLRFANQSGSIPISLSVHYDFAKLRVGAGFTFEQQFFNPLRPNVYKDSIRSLDIGYRSAPVTRFWGMAGYQFYDWWDFKFVGELRLGVVNYGRRFNSPFISNGLYYNLGVNIEKHLSEYFRITLRPSYDIKSFKISLPDGGSPIRFTNNAFFVQVGISINIPEIPRSPMKSDHIQLKHVLSDGEGRLYEYRGQPIWKVQNPKVGQNHRRLWRYKLKNRRKLDPY